MANFSINADGGWGNDAELFALLELDDGKQHTVSDTAELFKDLL